MLNLFSPEQKAASSNLAGCISRSFHTVIELGQIDVTCDRTGYFVHATKNASSRCDG